MSEEKLKELLIKIGGGLGLCLHNSSSYLPEGVGASSRRGYSREAPFLQGWLDKFAHVDLHSLLSALGRGENQTT